MYACMNIPHLIHIKRTRTFAHVYESATHLVTHIYRLTHTPTLNNTHVQERVLMKEVSDALQAEVLRPNDQLGKEGDVLPTAIPLGPLPQDLPYHQLQQQIQELQQQQPQLASAMAAAMPHMFSPPGQIQGGGAGRGLCLVHFDLSKSAFLLRLIMRLVSHMLLVSLFLVMRHDTCVLCHNLFFTLFCKQTLQLQPF